MRSLFFKKMGCISAIFFAIACTTAFAQTESDGIMIPKHYLCVGAMYSQSSWNNYWEGTFKRDNQNIGTLSTYMYGPMLIYGITGRLNLLASAPYVNTHASAGTLASMHGFQDLTTSVKWMPADVRVGSGNLSFYAIGSAVIPLTNYVADFLPMSIGLHCKSLMFRAMADYQTGNFFVTGSGVYNLRSNITIDRNAYYTTTLIYSNEVAMPNVSVFNFRAGYRTPKVIAEAVLENATTLGGFDIRKNDMPFPSNKMNATTAGANFKYSLNSGLEFTAGGDYVVAGRNVGQSTILHAGVDYLFSVKRSHKSTADSQTQDEHKL